MMRRVRVSLAVSILLLACGGDNGSTEPQGLDPTYANYPTDFPISVSSGLTPTISWSGVRGGSLDITDYNGNTITNNEPWQFFSSTPNVGFASPVHYGTLPAGAHCGLFGEATDNCPVARPLVKGHLYQLIIITPDFQAGVKFFIP
jgi:hypothetical protein